MSCYNVRIILALQVVMMMWCIGEGTDYAEIMKTISYSIGHKIRKCIAKLHLDEDVLGELLQYWESKKEPSNAQVGCAIMCAFEELNLLRDNEMANEPNVNGFVTAAGGDSQMVNTLVKLYHACKKLSPSDDRCAKALETTNCMRDSILKSSWFPDIKVDQTNTRKCGEDVMFIDVN